MIYIEHRIGLIYSLAQFVGRISVSVIRSQRRVGGLRVRLNPPYGPSIALRPQKERALQIT